MTKESIEKIMEQCLNRYGQRSQEEVAKLEDELHKLVSGAAWAVYLDIEENLSDEYAEALDVIAERLADHKS